MRGWILFTVMALSLAAWANDGYVHVEGTGGRASFVRGEHRLVAMVSETVCMDIYPNYYDVAACFVFHNTGKAVMVTMGFPERNVSREKDSGFTSFTTSVDRKPVPARRMLNRNVSAWKDGEYSALWVKRVWFADNQTRTVRVNYRSKPGAQGTTATGDNNFALYQFTGGNWRGKVKESRLIVTWHIPGMTSYALKLPNKERITLQAHQSNGVTIHWRNWQAQGDADISYCTIDRGWLGCPDGQWGMMMGSPFIPDGDVYVPDRSAPVNWTPPAIVRREVVFGNLRKLGEDKGPMSWDARHLEADWWVDTHHLRFRVGRARVEVDGKSQRLPAAPFLSCADHYGQRTFFVPIQTILPYIHWRAKINKAQHRIFFTPVKDQPSRGK